MSTATAVAAAVTVAGCEILRRRARRLQSASLATADGGTEISSDWFLGLPKRDA